MGRHREIVRIFGLLDKRTIRYPESSQPNGEVTTIIDFYA